MVIVLPQGTIPRGHDVFDPVLHGRTGTARLAAVDGGDRGARRVVGDREGVAAVVAGARLHLVRNPPKVTVRVGKPLALSLTDARADTQTIMQAISALLPAEGAGPPRADARGAGAHQTAEVTS